MSVSALAVAHEPWEQQVGESPQAFHAFVHYRDLEPLPGRHSRDEAWREHVARCKPRASPSEAPGSWVKWQRVNGWVMRVEAYTTALDRVVTGGWMEEAEEVGRRHARVAADTLLALYQPVLAIAKVLERKPEVLAALAEEAGEDPKVFLGLLDMARNMSGVMPAVAKMEREALGLGESETTEEHTVKVVLQFDDEFQL